LKGLLSQVRILFGPPSSLAPSRSQHSFAKIARFSASFWARYRRRDAVSAKATTNFEESLCRPAARSTHHIAGRAAERVLFEPLHPELLALDHAESRGRVPASGSRNRLMHAFSSDVSTRGQRRAMMRFRNGDWRGRFLRINRRLR
jgi:hypothetical protein